MIKKHFVKWMPLVLMLIMGYTIGYLIKPRVYPKYVSRLQTNNGKLLADGQKIFYTDTDNDGHSEEFIYYHLSDNRQPVINKYDYNGDFQNIWYLDGEIIDQFEFISGDYNNDSLEEVYVFSRNKEGVLLYGLQTNKSNQFVINKAKVANFTNHNEQHHIVIHSSGLYDLNNDGFKEFVFSINDRFNSEPRCLIAYDIANDTILKTEEFDLQTVGKPVVFDLNNDSCPEIFMSTLNSTNYIANSKNENPINSSCIVFNNKLEKLFKPIDYSSRMSVTAAYPYIIDADNGIFSLSWSLSQSSKAILRLLDTKGNIKTEIKTKNENFVFDHWRTNWNGIYTFSRLGEIKQYNNELKVINTLNVNDIINQVAFIDIDKNGTEELLVIKDNSLLIYEHNLLSGIEVSMPGLGVQKLYFGVKVDAKQTNYLSIQTDNYQYLLSYYKHPRYWARYFFFIFTALLMAGIYLLIRFLVKKHIENVRKLERESIYLHLDLVKYQLDPHFVFNALNSIAFSINKDDRKTAYSNLGIFSKFMRETIDSMDDYGRSLEDELKAVKYYLELEKFRFKDRFDYDFILSPEVVTSIKVPKMCIYSYVEGALKKGILPQEKHGRIEIKVDIFNQSELVIIVSDNGRYRNLADENENAKSMKIMERSIVFFNRYNITNIKVYYNNIGKLANPKGSKVEIHVPINLSSI